MGIVSKVANSRNIILEISNNYEWDISKVPILSKHEIEMIYNLENSKNSVFSSFGISAGCSFKLTHKHIPSHNLVVLYYNMPDGNISGVKVNKSLIDKILNLYRQDVDTTALDVDDSLLILINEPIKNTIMNINNSINILLQQSYDQPSDTIIKEMKESKYNVSNEYFRYVTIMDINSYQVNLLKHELVPQHYPIRDKVEIEEILKNNNATKNELPKIDKNDQIAKIIRLVPGNICKITRYTSTGGDSIYYRICK